MRNVLIAAWVATILAESVLLWRLVRRHGAGVPVFTAFVAFDLLRSMALLPSWLLAMLNFYGYGFRYTQYPDMILLGSAGIEAFGMAIGLRPPKHTYPVIIGMLLAVGYSLPPIDSQPHLINRLFMQRSFLVAVITCCLIFSMVWQLQWIPVHCWILVVFCAFDLLAYVTLAVFPVQGDPFKTPAIVLAGQAGCLGVWWWTTPSCPAPPTSAPHTAPHP